MVLTEVAAGKVCFIMLANMNTCSHFETTLWFLNTASHQYVGTYEICA